MRKFTLLFLGLLWGISVYSQTNVPNGDFETWYNVPVNANLNYDEIGSGPADNWMATLNSLASVPATMGGPGPITVYKSTDKHGGTYAAKCVSGNLQLGAIPVFIPGMIGTALLDMPGIRAILGKPCQDCRPVKLKGYYKYEPVQGDSCCAVLLLSKWNSTTKKRDTIGYGRWVQKAAVNTYTPFEVTPIYRSSGTIDSITMLIVSSAGFSVINFMGAVGRVGNTMYVDDLMLEYPAGIEQPLLPDVTVLLSPNPASETLKIELNRELKNAEIQIYSSNGKLSGSTGISSKTQTIPVYSLPNGVYHYKLISEKSVMNSGSFIINR